MKTKYLIAYLSFFLLSACSMQKIMFVEDESKYNFDKTVDTLHKALIDNDWTIPCTTNLQSRYAEFGYSGGSLLTMEICKPAAAAAIIGGDKRKRMSPMMPMRVSVYEKSNGMVYVSRMRLKMMKNFTTGVIRREMKQSAKDLNRAMERVLK